MIDDERYGKLQPMADELVNHCQKKLGFQRPPGLFFADSKENAELDFGKTAYYDPGKKEIVVFVTKRHNKDVLRSIAHEVVHHMQALRGDFEKIKSGDLSPGYAQKNPFLRKMEAEAYLLGNLLFRDWEDGIKQKEQEKKFIIRLGENKVMNKDKLREMVREKVVGILSEVVSEKKASAKEETIAEEAEIFAPNHYCVHHGGVNHNGNIELAEAVGHNYDKELGRVTHYDMKLEDGTILKDVPSEEIQITNASLAEGHGHPMKRDDEEEEELEETEAIDEGGAQGHREEEEKEEGEEIEEQSKTDRPDRVAGRDTGGRRLDEEEDEDLEESEKIKEEEINESKVWTTEREGLLNENRFGKRRNDLFERLMTSWVKK